MQKRNLFLISILCLFFKLNTFGQSPFFSQSIPVHQNPAMTGFLKEKQNRLVLKNRQQWYSSLESEYQAKTQAISIEHRTCSKPNFWGIGSFLLSDSHGVPAFKTLHGLLSLSYHHRLNRNLYLAAGINTGILDQSIEDNLIFPAQFDGLTSFDATLPTLENIEQLGRKFWDLGLGGLLYGKSKKGRNWHIGLSLQHINRSFQSKNNETQNLRTRKTIHGAFSKKSNDLNFTYKATFIWQAPHWQFTPAIEMIWKESWITGLSARGTKYEAIPNLSFIGSAITSSIGYRTENFSVILSYDFNFPQSTIPNTNAGTIEITAQYAFGKRKCVNCPVP